VVIVLGAGLASAASPAWKWSRVSVELPADRVLFRPGDGMEMANSRCLSCHSADMVLYQPSLTLDEWTAEINKMRTVYGAAVEAAQVEALARYLHGINGR